MLSNGGSIHTKRWVKALSERGLEICLFCLNNSDDSFYLAMDNVKVVNYHYQHHSSSFKESILQRKEFFKVVKVVRQIITDFRPDILHAHYAVDYGSIGAAVGFHPYIISVWGSDVYGDPKLSFTSKLALRYKLRKADLILSTSHVMAEETAKYTSKDIEITPFGVDTAMFAPNAKEPRNTIVIGTVKTLAPVYGIDTLIRAFAIVVSRNPEVKTHLFIVGEGSQKNDLERLASELGIADRVVFKGRIANHELPAIYNQFDVAVFLSQKESFGVAAVEAMACECPVVTSDAEGFTEIVENDETGFIVPKQNPDIAATAIYKLIANPALRKKMGKKARQRVKSLYDWEKNVDQMIDIYARITKNKIQ